MKNQGMDENNRRKLLLDFFSSEINTHGQLIIGFAVILLSVLQVAYYLPRPVSLLNYSIIIFGIFLVAFAISYTVMRLLVYGALANTVINVDILEPESVDQFFMRYHGHVFGIIPTSWFLSRQQQNRGFMLCVILSVIIALLMHSLIYHVALSQN